MKDFINWESNSGAEATFNAGAKISNPPTRPGIAPNGIYNKTGAPLRASTFSKDSKGRKQQPVASGVLDYFPDAIVAVSEVSQRGNAKHNPNEPLYWNREKSGDEADALMRHFLQRGTTDDDGIRHTAKVAWRALAMLQKEIESEEQPVAT